MHYVLEFLVFGLLTLFLYLYNFKCQNQLLQQSLLLEKWKIARQCRLQWREKHLEDSDVFSNPEYQRLFEIEIGACDLYLFALNTRRINFSWNDYLVERSRRRKNK